MLHLTLHITLHDTLLLFYVLPLHNTLLVVLHDTPVVPYLLPYIKSLVFYMLRSWCLACYCYPIFHYVCYRTKYLNVTL